MLRLALPLLLATLSAFFWFPLSREHLVGWGGDPYFNVWTFEEVWRHLAQIGIFRLFSAQMWQDPIFYPLPLTHALSENFLYAGALSWPIRTLTGNGVLTMNIMGFVMTLASFLFSGLWLRKLGARDLCWWGALIFSACGWVQSQNAHYQNICIFLFPLSFWLWLRFLEKSTLPRLIACALGFSWILGWNMYFQVFSNLIFCGLVVSQWKQKSLRIKFILMTALVALFEFPILLRYLQVESLIGSMSIGLDDFRDNSASIMSFLSWVGHRSLLQRILPFYPNPQMGIETAGFLGITWLILMALSFFRPAAERLRVWLTLALLAYLVSLGPDFIVMHPFRLFPGFGALRAVGRVQILVLLASLPAVCLFLERQSGWKKYLPVALILLELVPGESRPSIFISENLFGSPSAFAEKIASLPGHPSLLVLPTVNPDFQLASLQLQSPLLGGYSGRYPANAYLLARALDGVTSNFVTAEKTQESVDFSGTPWVVSIDDSISEKLKASSGFSFHGCYLHLGFNCCIFESAKNSSVSDAAKIRLGQDVVWEYPPQRKGHLAILRTKKDGILDYAQVGTCKLASYLKFSFLPEISVVNTMTGIDFRGVRYKKGDMIFQERSPQGIFSLPSPWRPSKRYEIQCLR